MTNRHMGIQIRNLLSGRRRDNTGQRIPMLALRKDGIEGRRSAWHAYVQKKKQTLRCPTKPPNKLAVFCLGVKINQLGRILCRCHILTSTKNASLIITNFLAMLYKNEQPRTASLCRGWAMLENDFNLICR